MEKAKRFSSEYTMLSIIEYLCLYSRKTPISKYHIMTKINGIKQQRPDRISLILNKLEQNGYIKSISLILNKLEQNGYIKSIDTSNANFI